MKKLLGIVTFLLICVSIIIFNPVQSNALDITLRWDANTESDLAGYKLYYKTETSGPIYDGIGATQGHSPITLQTSDINGPNYIDPTNSNPEFMVNGLNDVDRYFFALTAYDDELPENNESGYSNEVTNKYKLIIQINGGGSVNASPPLPTDGLYNLNQLVELTTTPDPGWMFSAWGGDYTNPLIMNDDKNVICTFIEISVQTYTLTVNIEGRGNVSPTGGVYEENTVVPVNATPAAGWEFVEWLNADGNPIGNNLLIDIYMDSNIVITAVFNNTPLVPPKSLILEFIE